MTTLTDLPDELITATFREFLSKELVDHQYLCRWEVEKGAHNNRANLYSLAMVSRRMSSIAMPLLYEQLFEETDLEEIFSGAVAGHKAYLQQHTKYIRYLSISIDAADTVEVTSGYMAALQELLVHCINISHVRLDIYRASFDTSVFLLDLAGKPSLRNLRSLHIYLSGSPSGRSTLFRDCSQSRSLSGIQINVSAEGLPMAHPDQPLLGVKQLKVDLGGDTQGILPCMALVSPKTLEILDIRVIIVRWPSVVTESQIFGSYTWEHLSCLKMNTKLRRAHDSVVTGSVQLPMLQTLHITSCRGEPLRDSIPTLPSSLKALFIETSDVDQLLEALSVIADDHWLGRKLQRVRIDFGNLYDDSQGADAPRTTRTHLLAAAREAIVATRSKGVILEPENILEKLAGVRVYVLSDWAV